jgi:hypothetical protein
MINTPVPKTEWGKWAKAVLMQEGDLPTVADCCRIAALLETNLAGEHVLHERNRLKTDNARLRAALEKAARQIWSLNDFSGEPDRDKVDAAYKAAMATLALPAPPEVT